MGCAGSKQADIDQKVSLLSCSPFFLHLSPSSFRLFASLFNIRELSAGEVLYNQGDPGSAFYVVAEGEIDITAREISGEKDGNKDDDGAQHGAANDANAASSNGASNHSEQSNSVYLCTKRKGDFFGSSAIIHSESIRGTTVTARRDCVLLELTRDHFGEYMDTLSAKQQGRLASLMGKVMLDALRGIDFLSDLGDEHLRLLANVFGYRTVAAGEVIFEEGDRGTELFVIAEGSVQISAKQWGTSHAASATSSNTAPEGEQNGTATAAASSSSTDSATPVTPAASSSASSSSSPSYSPSDSLPSVDYGIFKTGQYFGEVSLLVDLPRTATVRALDRCLLLVLSADHFRNFLKHQPQFSQRITQMASERIAASFRKFDVPFFRTLQQQRFEQLCRRCKIQVFQPGEVLFSEGEVPQVGAAAFYLLVSGQLSVHKSYAGGVVGTLCPPSYLGEIALVSDTPRTATITSLTRVVALSLTKEDFTTFFLDCQGSNDIEAGRALAEFSIKLSQSAVPLVHVLTHPEGYALFAKHVASEYSEENLKFWTEVQNYERMWTNGNRMKEMNAQKSDADSQQIVDNDAADSPTPEIVDVARSLCARFIDEQGEEQVNLPSPVRESCLKHVAEGRVTRDLFERAKQEVLKLMDTDSFKRFKQTPLFKQLLDRVGSYGTTRTSIFNTQPGVLSLIKQQSADNGNVHANGSSDMTMKQPLPTNQSSELDTHSDGADANAEPSHSDHEDSVSRKPDTTLDDVTLDDVGS